MTRKKKKKTKTNLMSVVELVQTSMLPWQLVISNLTVTLVEVKIKRSGKNLPLTTINLKTFPINICSPAKKLQMRNSLVKVKAIYSILCSIYNIKMKELKDKVHCSKNSHIMMSLYTECFYL